MSESLTRILEVLPIEDQQKLIEATVALTGAGAALGVPLTHEEVISCGVISDVVLAGQTLTPEKIQDGLAQLRQQESVAAKLAKKAESEQSGEDLAAFTAKMSPAERITWARQNLGSAPPPPSEMTKEEAARIAPYLSPAARLSLARKHGLA